jgi:hypothetical protein
LVRTAIADASAKADLHTAREQATQFPRRDERCAMNNVRRSNRPLASM